MTCCCMPCCQGAACHCLLSAPASTVGGALACLMACLHLCPAGLHRDEARHQHHQRARPLCCRRCAGQEVPAGHHCCRLRCVAGHVVGTHTHGTLSAEAGANTHCWWPGCAPALPRELLGQQLRQSCTGSPLAAIRAWSCPTSHSLLLMGELCRLRVFRCSLRGAINLVGCP